jgi:hypothetical protein
MILRNLLALGLAVAASAALAADIADKSVQRQLDKRKIQYRVDADGDFRVTYEIGGGRTQLAFVRSATFSYGKLRIREIRSIGWRGDGAFPQSVANRMLEHSNEAKLGAWTKQGNLAIFTTKIAADASDQQLVDAIELTARLADELEKELVPAKDEF